MQVCVNRRFDQSHKRFKVDGARDRDRQQSAPNPPSHGESNFGDSSGPLFSTYSKAAEDEDNKMVERWQKDADGILIFVSASCWPAYC